MRSETAYFQVLDASEAIAKRGGALKLAAPNELCRDILRIGGVFERFIASHMIKMTMGVDDGREGEVVFFKGRQNMVDITAGVDDRRFAGLFASDNVAIGL